MDSRGSRLDDIDDDDTPVSTIAVPTTAPTASSTSATLTATPSSIPSLSSSAGTSAASAAQHVAAASTTDAIAVPASSSSSSSASPSSFVPSGLDDIDDDYIPATLTNGNGASSSSFFTPAAASASASSTSSTAAASSSASSDPGASDVQRILSVLEEDRALALKLPVPIPPATPIPPQPNHFAVLCLPDPDMTSQGEILWTVSDNELNRAFKRLVVLVHPDKCIVTGASIAFDAVKSAHGTLNSSASRYDYLKAYGAYRRAILVNSADYVPPSVTTASLSETLSQGRKIAQAKSQQLSSITSRLQSQAASRIQSVVHGELARKKKDEEQRREELKRKVMQSDSDSEAKSSGSDDDENTEMSTAAKIRKSRQGKQKKFRQL